VATEYRPTRRQRRRRTPVVGPAIALLGSAAVLISAWLPWLGVAGVTAKPFDVPAFFLLDSSAGLSGLRLGVLVVVIGVVGIAGALIPGLRFLPILVGFVALAVGGLFYLQTNYLLDFLQGQLTGLGLGGVNDTIAALNPDLTDLIDYGVYVMLAGGAAATVGGILSLARV
jgi:hypothetical protein